MKKLLLFLFVNLSILFADAQCNDPSDIQIQNNEYAWLLELVVSWEANGMDTWDIEYGQEGFTPTGIPNIDDHTQYYIYLSDIELDHSQYFDFYIRTDCGTTTSDWVGPYTLYYYCQDSSWGTNVYFEYDFIPYCWMESDTGTPQAGIGFYGNSNWEQGFFANNSENTLSAKINITGTDVNEWLIQPLLIGIQGLKNYESYYLEFDLALTEAGTMNASQLGADDVFQIVISYDFGASWYTIRSWDSSTPISNTGEQVMIDHGNETDGWDMFYYPFLVAFYVSSGDIDDANVDLFIDNLGAYPPITNVSEYKNLGLSIFPNPVDDTFSILELQNDAEIKIFNNMGQLVKTISFRNDQNTINVSELKKGIYFLQIHSGQQIYNSRFIKK